MRTTIDLPEPLHRIARSLARHQGRSLSDTVADLMRKGLEADAAGPLAATGPTPTFAPHPLTGLPVARSQRVLTPEDVSALEDEA